MGGEGTGGGAEAPRAARKAVTLHYWSRFGPGQSRPYVQTGEYEDQRLPVFMEQQAPVKVERTAISNHTELLDKLTVAFVSGTGPDVFNIGSPGVAQFAHPGFLLPLDGYPRAKKEAADFFESGLRIGSYKGKLYGFTYYADMRIMLYRKDLLAQAGLPAERQALPKTWDQLRELARKLTRWEGGQISRIGFDVPKTDEALWFNVVHQQGVDVLNKELTRATVGGAEGERALQLMVDLLHRDRVDANERPTFPAGVPAIGSQYMASGYRSSAELESFRQSNLDPQQLLVSDFTPEWTGKTTATGYLGGTWVLVAKQNKDADAALDLQPVPGQLRPADRRGGDLLRRPAPQVGGQVGPPEGPPAADVLRGRGEGLHRPRAPQVRADQGQVAGGDGAGPQAGEERQGGGGGPGGVHQRPPGQRLETEGGAQAGAAGRGPGAAGAGGEPRAGPALDRGR